mgnify:CR=1 FL=1
MTWNGRAFDTYVEPLLGPQQEIIGSVGLALDVTERRSGRGGSAAERGAKARDPGDLARRDRDHGSRRSGRRIQPRRGNDVRVRAIRGGGTIPRGRHHPRAPAAAHRDGLAGFPGERDGRAWWAAGSRSIAVRKDGSEVPVELAITRIPLDGPPSFAGHIRDLDRPEAGRSRAPGARRAAPPGAADGGDRDLGRRRGPRLQQHPHGDPGLHGPLEAGWTHRSTASRRPPTSWRRPPKRGAVLTQQLLGFARKGKNESTAVDLAG